MTFDQFELVQLSKSAYALVNSEDDSVSGGFGSNQGILLLESSVLVFDTGLTTGQASALKRAIASLTSNPVRYVINSHDHSDHVFGNHAFVTGEKKSQTMILAHEICRQNMASKAQRKLEMYRKTQSGQLFEGLHEIPLPNLTYLDNSLRMRLEGMEIYLVHPPTGAHTLGDTLMVLPSEGVLFAGDTVWNGFFPNLEDANLEGWIAFLSDLDLGACRVCLPGHGKVCSPDQVREFRDYLAEVRRRIMLLEITKSEERKKEPEGGTNQLLLQQQEEECFAHAGTTDGWKLRQTIDSNVRALLEIPTVYEDSPPRSRRS